MTAKHAGVSRLSDTSLLDRIEAARQEMRHMLATVPRFTGLDTDECVQLLHERNSRKNALLGRALAILDEIAERNQS